MARFEKGQLARHVTLGVVKIVGRQTLRDCKGQHIKFIYHIAQDGEPSLDGNIPVTFSICQESALEPLESPDPTIELGYFDGDAGVTASWDENLGVLVLSGWYEGDCKIGTFTIMLQEFCKQLNISPHRLRQIADRLESYG
jgi:hypothetical protein